MALSIDETQAGISTLSDEVLVRHYVECRDMDVFGELYRRYSHLVFGTCLKYLKNKEESRDTTMEVFELILHKLPQQSEIRSFNHWIYSVTKNECLSKLRKSGRLRITSAEEQEVDHIRHGFMENEGFTRLYDEGNPDMDGLLHRAMEQLNDEQRACIRAFYLEKRSYKEVSDTLDMPLGKVKSHIQNGKRNLKLIITELMADKREK